MYCSIHYNLMTKKRKEDRHDLYLYRQSILEDDVLSNSSYGPFDCNMNVSIFF